MGDPTTCERPSVPLDEDGVGLSDDELAALALAAAPSDVATEDAINYWDVVAPQDRGLLPDWYMPVSAAGAGRLSFRRQLIAWALVLAFVGVNLAGLCSTYGEVVRAGL